MTTPRKNTAAKSHKADGTPKKRWSSTERAARGHGPRTRGGQRDDRGSEKRSFSRDGDKRPFSRDDRPATEDRRPARDDRGFNRDDRGGERRTFNRDDRGGERRTFSRDDRGGRTFNRDDRGSGRDDRGGERRTFNRDDRGDRGFNRDDRGGERRTFNRDDRGGERRTFNRDDRGGRAFNRDDRGGERRTFNRDDRGGERGTFNRDDRGGERRTFNRDDRGGERGTFNRDDRGGERRTFNRDDRGTDRPRNERHFADSGNVRDRRGPARDFQDRAPRKHREQREHGSWRDSGPRDHDGGAPESDQMDWVAAETLDLQVTDADAASGFAELGVALPMVATLASKGITEPFPIQRATIADAIAGRDVLGRGRTGSGKTLAFGLPMLTRLAAGPAAGSPRAMILTPTRELALQIADNLSPLAASVGLDLTLIAGGMPYGPQIRAFERGVDVLVATPGRLIDLLEQGAADLSQVQVTVLDEADHMSDLGFMPDVQTLLNAVPAEGQRLLFSATLDGAVDRLVRKYLHDPVTHEVDSGQASITTMTHHFLELAPHHKNSITAEVANREGKSLIFARTQMGADRIAGQLRDAGVLAGALHGGLTQGARARVLAAFKDDSVRVLVATDVAARGIHVDDVSLVLQVDPPMGPKDYLHRAGRTARAGESGSVVSIVLPHQRKQVRRIAEQAGVRVNPLHVQPGSVELREATGARIPSDTPIAEADYMAIIAPKQQQRSRPKHGGGARGGFRRGGARRDKW